MWNNFTDSQGARDSFTEKHLNKAEDTLHQV